MEKSSAEANHGEELTLTVDDRGRIPLSREVQEQLGISPNDEIPATLVGSVLQLNPRSSSKRDTATAGGEKWENTAPDAGDSFSGPMERENSLDD